jgi:hypothetical protein
MEFEPTEYARRPFNVKAEEVTYENIEAVATWCKGRIDSESTKVFGGGEVKLPVIKFPGQGEDRGKELVARLGYFVVYSKGRFRVYKAPQFHAAFEKKVETVDGVIDGKTNYDAMTTYQKQIGDQEVWINPGEEDTTIAGIDDSEFTEHAAGQL